MSFSKKIVLIIIVTLGLIIGFNGKVFASSISVSASKSSVEAGETFSVTITGNDATGKINVSVGNGSGSQSVWLENNSQTISVTAGESGTVTISASGEVSDNSGNDQNVSASKTVAIKEKIAPTENNNSNTGSSNNPDSTSNHSSTNTVKPTKSNNANLSNLVVSPVDFKGFKASKTSGYSVTVENDVTEVKIKATAQDSKASIKVSGNEDLKEGANTVSITVTAEDGTQKTYKVTVNRKASKDEESATNTTTQTNEKIEENVVDEPRVTEEVILGLKSIKMSGKTNTEVTIEPSLTPEFKINIYEYTTTIPIDVENIEIEAIPSVEGAKVEVLGNNNLQVGENVITILVKSQNEDEQKNYQIIVKKTDESLALNNNTELVKKIIVGIIIAILIIAITIAVVIYKKGNKKTKKIERINNFDFADEILGETEESKEEKNNSFDGRKTGKRFK